MNVIKPSMSWEQAVLKLQADPAQAVLLKACYLDDPLLDAAKRFAASDEWQAVRQFLAGRQGQALDLGAGRGIASFALAVDGWRVHAIEPDPSRIVGAGAIQSLADQSGLPLEIVRAGAEDLPFASGTIDVVYGRQVFHHLSSLGQACAEIRRVLKPHGLVLATREHVIRREADREVFLASHPTHSWTGTENAFRLATYLDAFRAAGLRVVTVLRPMESPINYAPMTLADWRVECLRPLVRLIGWRRTLALAGGQTRLGRLAVACGAMRLKRSRYAPGAVFTIIAERGA